MLPALGGFGPPPNHFDQAPSWPPLMVQAGQLASGTFRNLRFSAVVVKRPYLEAGIFFEDPSLVLDLQLLAGKFLYELLRLYGALWQ